MKVKFIPNQRAIKNLSNAQIDALKMTNEQLLNEVVTEQVIPFDTGALQNIATYSDIKEANKGVTSIVHDSPYATRLYYHPEYNFDKTTNPNAKGEWWEPWLTGEKKSRPSELFKKFYRMLTKGVVK